ncbi:hypothetical protein [Syntrophorhabdus aromaticivorans]|jgi:hypothetical protein|uniref:hypothetical protein n=1 Tax=Syntrophorhabdus aromaticivorans TaxID=328301 RepID=UPI0003FF77DA|nr:hypothetical protein [Syntrophorhabdus aromaticivorans]OPY59670.1 MAG: hypothetical protein A4E57_04671 [Syntrophorhabdaceae bacterium PtaU1.Bin034]HOD74561.1 hypothetical protein [Syntrophorhabdaceae bacterium]
MDKGKAAIWKIIAEMHEKMKDHDPQKIGKLIDEAVKETRKPWPVKTTQERGR